MSLQQIRRNHLNIAMSDGDRDFLLSSMKHAARTLIPIAVGHRLAGNIEKAQQLEANLYLTFEIVAQLHDSIGLDELQEAWDDASLEVDEQQ